MSDHPLGNLEMKTSANETIPLSCDLTAIPADTREEHVVSAPQLFALAQEVHELSNGYAIRFLNEPGRFMAIAKFIESERLCCPFFSFGLDVEPNLGPLWLRLTGGAGVKEIFQAALFENDEEKLSLKQLIHTGGNAHLDEVVAQMQFPVLKEVREQPSTE